LNRRGAAGKEKRDENKSLGRRQKAFHNASRIVNEADIAQSENTTHTPAPKGANQSSDNNSHIPHIARAGNTTGAAATAAVPTVAPQAVAPAATDATPDATAGPITGIAAAAEPAAAVADDPRATTALAALPPTPAAEAIVPAAVPAGGAT